VRTTLTLDDHVASLVRDEMSRSGLSYKETVNRLITDGGKYRRIEKKRKRFVVTPFDLDLGLGTRYEKVADLIEAQEGPNYR